MDVVFKAEACSKPVRIGTFVIVCVCLRCVFSYPARATVRRNVSRRAGSGESKTTRWYYFRPLHGPYVPLKTRLHRAFACDSRRTPGCVTRGSVGSTSGSGR